MKTQEDLEHDEPHSSTTSSSRLRSTCSKRRRRSTASTGRTTPKAEASFASGNSVVGHDLASRSRNYAQGRERGRRGRLFPKEGSTGWSDTWMISSKAAHPNCMYLWMDHIVSPQANATDDRVRTARHRRTPRRVTLTSDPNHLRARTTRTDADVLGEHLLLDRLRWQTAATTAARSARTTASGSRHGPRFGVVELDRQRRGAAPGSSAGGACRPFSTAGLAFASRALLATPVGWLGDRLPRLAGRAVRRRRSGASTRSRQEIVPRFSLHNFRTLIGARLSDDHVPYCRDGGRGHDHGCRSRLSDRLLHGTCRHSARESCARRRGTDATLGELPREGLRLADHPPGRGCFELDAQSAWTLWPRVREVRALARLFVPLAPVHDFAHLRGARAVPSSLLEASFDLGASGFRTFRSVVLPIAFPAVVAGSIFTFSLTLGDYIAPQIVGTRQFIGNVVYANVGVAGNLPLAAAFATVPVMIMIVYLLLARRAGAFESL